LFSKTLYSPVVFQFASPILADGIPVAAGVVVSLLMLASLLLLASMLTLAFLPLLASLETTATDRQDDGSNRQNFQGDGDDNIN
jgi:hypothetical protein